MSQGLRARWVLVSMLTFSTPICQDARAGQLNADRNLLLDVVVNDHPIGIVGDFHERDGALCATRHELELLGFQLGKADAPPGSTTEIALDGLSGVSTRIDERAQRVFITALNSRLVPTQLFSEHPNDLPLESGWGGVVNYSGVATRAQGRTVGEALLDTRMFNPWGVASTSLVASSAATYGTRSIARLDSTYTYSDPESLRRYRGGDLITGGLPWTRPVRLGGVQVTTDFNMRPDLVTFPTPTISGQVAVPSSVDVLVNGVQILSREVAPGPFELRQLPVVTGAGNVSMVVHDATGQEKTTVLPVYVSSLLLAADLTAFSAEAGKLRLNYGLSGDTYRAPAGSFTVRHGLTDWLTLQGHGEGSAPATQYGGNRAPAGGMAGGGAAFRVGHLGVVSVDAAGSRFGGHGGTLLSAAVERITPFLSVAGSIQVTSGKFGDIASAYGEPVPRLQARASIGVPLGSAGSFGVAYVWIRRNGNRAAADTETYSQQPLNSPFGLGLLSLPEATRVSLLSISYSRQFFDGLFYFYLTGFRDFSTRSNSGFLAGITAPVGRRGSAGASVGGGQGGTRGTFQANQSASTIGDFGGQVLATAGSQSRQLAVGEYKSPFALIDAGADRIAGETAFRGSIQGAVATAGGGVFAANTIHDSFAIVDTDKAAGIEVLQENRPIGRTGPSGQILVPDLRSFDANRIGIDPRDVPLDADVPEITRMVRPQDRSGIVVHFPVRPSHGAVVRLTEASGTPLPLGSRATLESKGMAGGEIAVGYGGEAFITGLDKHNSVIVTKRDGQRCRASFDYEPVPGSLPTIGPVLCATISP